MTITRVLVFVAAIVAAGAASAAGLTVPMDEVRLVAFKKPVSTVYLGNPSIADLTVIDSRHVFVLGKTFGTTNLIALGDDKSVIANESVTVFGRSAGAVTLNRGAETFTYTCTSRHCETGPVPGDEKTYFGNAESEAGTHEDDGTKAATPVAAAQSPH